MKRLLSVLAVLLFVSGIVFGDTVSKKVYSFGILNKGGPNKITVIPTTSIRPGVDKIIGYSVMPAVPGPAELYIGIFDQTNKWLSGEVIAENEANTPWGTGELWPFGKWIFNGVVVNQGANTQVQIYFISE